MMSNITTSSECEDNKASVIGERTNRGSEEHGNIFSLLVVSTHMEFVQRKKWTRNSVGGGRVCVCLLLLLLVMI